MRTIPYSSEKVGDCSPKSFGRPPPCNTMRRTSPLSSSTNTRPWKPATSWRRLKVKMKFERATGTSTSKTSAGCHGLGERIHPCTSAAHRGLRALPELDARDSPQDLARLIRDLLPVAEVAGLVVGYRDRLRTRWGRKGPAKPDLHEPFRDVAHPGRPRGCAPGELRVAGEEVAVALQVGAAARGIRDDRVVLARVDRFELPAGELPGRLEVAVVGVERAAAGLAPRRRHLAAVLEEHVDGGPVHVGEGDVLDAAGKEGDQIGRGTARLLDGGDDGVGKMPADGDRLPLELAEPPGKEGEEPRPAQQPAEPAGLVEPEQPARRVERPRAEQEEAQRKGADQPAQGAGRRAAPLRLGAPRLEERAVVDPRRARGRAREAPEAVVHLLRKRLGRLRLAGGDLEATKAFAKEMDY